MPHAPSTLKGGAAQKVAAKLVTAGLVREIKAKGGMEAWRRDLVTGQAYSLKLTDAGLRLKAIRVDVAKRLSESNLTVAAVAARSAVTPRYVHKLFESEGTTFSHFVRERRLDLAHRLLTDRRLADRSIASIAFDAGFSDLSNFNRAFRRRYNATPSEVRASCR